jgi:hypothetical protein
MAKKGINIKGMVAPTPRLNDLMPLNIANIGKVSVRCAGPPNVKL